MDEVLAGLQTASRDELLTLIAHQQQLIGHLQRRVADLERRLGSSGGAGLPGLKPTRPQPKPHRARQRRPDAYVRRRSPPTAQVRHALDHCPDCGTRLLGGAVQRRREVLDVPLSPVVVTEHVFIKRRCPLCARNWVPTAAAGLAGVAVGRSRLGPTVTSLIVVLRELGRWPVRAIQWCLRLLFGLDVGLGTIVAACHRVAEHGAAALAQIRDQIRASPVVHADETGWREAGRNGYLWTFSTPTACYYLRRTRSKAVVDEVLGDQAAAVLVSDFYAAYHHYPGVKQRCWAHLLRAVRDLQTAYPDDARLATWAEQLVALYRAATQALPTEEQARRRLQQDLQLQLQRLCTPVLADPLAVHARLCRRLLKHGEELFVCVADPQVPADNNAAERSLRPQVVHRKISGGTRSARGTATKFALASLLETAQRQGHSPFRFCRQLLLAPQP